MSRDPFAVLGMPAPDCVVTAFLAMTTHQRFLEENHRADAFTAMHQIKGAVDIL